MTWTIRTTARGRGRNTREGTPFFLAAILFHAHFMPKTPRPVAVAFQPKGRNWLTKTRACRPIGASPPPSLLLVPAYEKLFLHLGQLTNPTKFAQNQGPGHLIHKRPSSPLNGLRLVSRARPKPHLCSSTDSAPMKAPARGWWASIHQHVNIPGSSWRVLDELI